MRKIKFVKQVIPETIGYFGVDAENTIPDYRCTNCWFGVAEFFEYCPFCGSELAWERVKKEQKAFKSFELRRKSNRR